MDKNKNRFGLLFESNTLRTVAMFVVLAVVAAIAVLGYTYEEGVSYGYGPQLGGYYNAPNEHGGYISGPYYGPYHNYSDGPYLYGQISPLGGILINFNSNGGTPASFTATTTETQGGTGYVRIGVAGAWPPQPSLPGFTFMGWNTQPNGSGTNITRDTWFCADNWFPGGTFRTVYAVWGLALRFSGNGIDLPGSDGAPTPPEPDASCVDNYGTRMVPVNMSVTQAMATGWINVVWPNDPNRTGFNFLGWYNVPTVDGGIAVNAGTPISAETIAFARWEPANIRDVIFDPSITALGITPPGIIAPGHSNLRRVVQGWSIRASSTNVPGFNSINPSILWPHSAPLATRQIAPGQYMTLEGWWTGHDGIQGTGIRFASPGGVPIGGGATQAPIPQDFSRRPVDDDMTVYANWVYRVTFMLNGGEVIVDSQPDGFYDRHINAANHRWFHFGQSGYMLFRDIPYGTPLHERTVAQSGRQFNYGPIGLPGGGVDTYTFFEQQFFNIGQMQERIYLPDGTRAPGFIAAQTPSTPVSPYMSVTRPGFLFNGWWSHPMPATTVIGGVPRHLDVRNPSSLVGTPWANTPFEEFTRDCEIPHSMNVYAHWVQNPYIMVTFIPGDGQWYRCFNPTQQPRFSQSHIDPTYLNTSNEYSIVMVYGATIHSSFPGNPLRMPPRPSLDDRVMVGWFTNPPPDPCPNHGNCVHCTAALYNAGGGLDHRTASPFYAGGAPGHANAHDHLSRENRGRFVNHNTNITEAIFPADSFHDATCPDGNPIRELRLYAHYAPYIAMTFDGNGADPAPGANQGVLTRRVAYGNFNHLDGNLSTPPGTFGGNVFPVTWERLRSFGAGESLDGHRILTHPESAILPTVPEIENRFRWPGLRPIRANTSGATGWFRPATENPTCPTLPNLPPMSLLAGQYFGVTGFARHASSFNLYPTGIHEVFGTNVPIMYLWDMQMITNRQIRWYMQWGQPIEFRPDQSVGGNTAPRVITVPVGRTFEDMHLNRHMPYARVLPAPPPAPALPTLVDGVLQGPPFVTGPGHTPAGAQGVPWPYLALPAGSHWSLPFQNAPAASLFATFNNTRRLIFPNPTQDEPHHWGGDGTGGTTGPIATGGSSFLGWFPSRTGAMTNELISGTTMAPWRHPGVGEQLGDIINVVYARWTGTQITFVATPAAGSMGAHPNPALLSIPPQDQTRGFTPSPPIFIINSLAGGMPDIPDHPPAPYPSFWRWATADGMTVTGTTEFNRIASFNVYALWAFIIPLNANAPGRAVLGTPHGDEVRGEPGGNFHFNLVDPPSRVQGGDGPHWRFFNRWGDVGGGPGGTIFTHDGPQVPTILPEVLFAQWEGEIVFDPAGGIIPTPAPSPVQAGYTLGVDGRATVIVTEHYSIASHSSRIAGPPTTGTNALTGIIPRMPPNPSHPDPSMVFMGWRVVCESSPIAGTAFTENTVFNAIYCDDDPDNIIRTAPSGRMHIEAVWHQRLIFTKVGEGFYPVPGEDGVTPPRAIEPRNGAVFEVDMWCTLANDWVPFESYIWCTTAGAMVPQVSLVTVSGNNGNTVPALGSPTGPPPFAAAITAPGDGLVVVQLPFEAGRQYRLREVIPPEGYRVEIGYWLINMRPVIANNIRGTDARIPPVAPADGSGIVVGPDSNNDPFHQLYFVDMNVPTGDNAQPGWRSNWHVGNMRPRLSFTKMGRDLESELCVQDIEIVDLTGTPQEGARFAVERRERANPGISWDTIQWARVYTSEPSGADGVVTITRPFTPYVPDPAYVNALVQYRLREIDAPSGYIIPVFGRWNITTNRSGGVETMYVCNDFNMATQFYGWPFVAGDDPLLCIRARRPWDVRWFVGNTPTRYWPFLKTDANIFDNIRHSYLPGAVFILFVYTGDGAPGANNQMVTPADMFNNNQDSTWRIVTTAESNGGLPLNPMWLPMMPGRHYQLVEVLPPAGYQLPWGQWRITVNVDELETNLLRRIRGSGLSHQVVGSGTPEIIPAPGGGTVGIICDFNHLQSGYRYWSGNNYCMCDSCDCGDDNCCMLNMRVYYIANMLDFNLPLTGGTGASMTATVAGSSLVFIGFVLIFAYAGKFKLTMKKERL